MDADREIAARVSERQGNGIARDRDPFANGLEIHTQVSNTRLRPQPTGECPPRRDVQQQHRRGKPISVLPQIQTLPAMPGLRIASWTISVRGSA